MGRPQSKKSEILHRNVYAFLSCYGDNKCMFRPKLKHSFFASIATEECMYIPMKIFIFLGLRPLLLFYQKIKH